MEMNRMKILMWITILYFQSIYHIANSQTLKQLIDGSDNTKSDDGERILIQSGGKWHKICVRVNL